MSLGNAIKILCPDISNNQLDLALEILSGGPLVPHTKLRKANFGLLPVVSSDKKSRQDALLDLGEAMLQRCKGFFAALASTQVGIPFPLVVFFETGRVCSHLGFASKSWKHIPVFEGGCGSLPRGAYIVRYPAKVCIYGCDFDGKRFSVESNVGSWFGLQIRENPLNGEDVAKVIHETKHLCGLTSVHCGILHPSRIGPGFWVRVLDNLVSYLDVEIRDAIMDEFIARGRFSSDKAETGKLAFIKYVELVEKEQPTYLLPSSWWERSLCRVVSADEYADEVRKLL